jgi:hypothetical protein
MGGIIVRKFQMKNFAMLNAAEEPNTKELPKYKFQTAHLEFEIWSLATATNTFY